MWTCENRSLYERKGARYPSDLRDAEWALIAPLIPPAKRGGRRREVDVREVMNGVLYVLETGCQWRALPKDLPPKSTVHDYLMLWDWAAGPSLTISMPNVGMRVWKDCIRPDPEARYPGSSLAGKPLYPGLSVRPKRS